MYEELVRQYGTGNNDVGGADRGVAALDRDEYGQALPYMQPRRTKEINNPNYIRFDLSHQNCKGYGLIGDSAHQPNVDDITSNLAYDRFLGIFAYGTSKGHIKLINSKGFE